MSDKEELGYSLQRNSDLSGELVASLNKNTKQKAVIEKLTVKLLDINKCGVCLSRSMSWDIQQTLKEVRELLDE